MNKEDLILERTCYACPQQYNCFYNGKQVGYLRLRHGRFTVDYPDVNGEEIYYACPKGDGIFDEDEEEFYLNEAKEAIIKKLKENE